jgi:SPP1 gp7 family putative phage head morphogenesis protein
MRQLIKTGKLPTNATDLEIFLQGMYDEVHKEKVGQRTAEDTITSAGRGYKKIARELRRQGFEFNFSTLPQHARDKLYERHLKFSDDTYKRIRGDVKANLLQSIDEGVGIDEAAARLQKEFDEIAEYRTRLIARTEIQSAQNEGEFQNMEDNNVDYIQWITAEDDRVRHSHEDLHGCVVKRGELFPNGLKHPGDRDGDISEYANCRCVAVPYIPEAGEVIPETPYYP